MVTDNVWEPCPMQMTDIFLIHEDHSRWERGWCESVCLITVFLCIPAQLLQVGGLASWGGGWAHTLITVDTILALGAVLAGCPTEALSTLTGTCAIYAIQADSISKADILSFPRAGLALGSKVPSAAGPGLKHKVRVRHGSLLSCFVQPQCRDCWWEQVCACVFDP